MTTGKFTQLRTLQDCDAKIAQLTADYKKMRNFCNSLLDIFERLEKVIEENQELFLEIMNMEDCENETQE